MNKIFVTAINCIDGRVQEPVSEYLKKHYHADFVDDITHPGTDKFFVLETQRYLDEIKRELAVSVNAHGSKVVAITGHHECAANPVSKEEHLQELKKAVEVIKAWNLLLNEVIGLYVNENWKVERII
jgi:phosphoserine phosphatase